MTARVDLAVIGGGLLGLAHAHAALARGLIIRLIADADQPRPNGSPLASVTGQRRGNDWTLALRAKSLWQQIAQDIGLELPTTGLVMIARRMPALGVLESFISTEMGAVCQSLSAADIRKMYPGLEGQVSAGLFSPHERLIPGADIIPRWLAWLKDQPGFSLDQSHLRNIDGPRIETDQGSIQADAQVICPVPDHLMAWPDKLRRLRLSRSGLRLIDVTDPRLPQFPSSVMSDLSLIQCPGFGDTAPARLLADRLMREQPTQIRIRLHVAISPIGPGQLRIIAYHHLDPAQIDEDELDRLILEKYELLFGRPPASIDRRISEPHLTSEQSISLIEPMGNNARLVLALGGQDASIAPALAQDVIDQLIDR